MTSRNDVVDLVHIIHYLDKTGNFFFFFFFPFFFLVFNFWVFLFPIIILPKSIFLSPLSLSSVTPTGSSIRRFRFAKLSLSLKSQFLSLKSRALRTKSLIYLVNPNSSTSDPNFSLKSLSHCRSDDKSVPKFAIYFSGSSLSEPESPRVSPRPTNSGHGLALFLFPRAIGDLCSDLGFFFLRTSTDYRESRSIL